MEGSVEFLSENIKKPKLIELFYIGMSVVETDGRAGVRSRDHQIFSDG